MSYVKLWGGPREDAGREGEPEAVADVVAADDKEALALDGAAVAPASTASKTRKGNNSSGPRISIH